MTNVKTVKVGVVITTIGREDALDRLLRSIAAQEHPVTCVVIADQSPKHQLVPLVERWRMRLPVQHVKSGRGASAGRNDGLAALPPVDVVSFPDDDVWYDRHTVQRAVAALPAPEGCVSGRLYTTLGLRARMPAKESRAFALTPRSQWLYAMEATCFFGRRYFDQAGTFDGTIGVGAPTPWQSGEISDLLLRGLQRRLPVHHDPAISVYDATGVDPFSVDYRNKARRYARGTGYVMRRHHHPGRLALALAAPAAQILVSAARGRRAEAALKSQVLLGRAEGMSHRVSARH